jgi:integral membrane protein (TIGR00529 family)
VVPSAALRIALLLGAMVAALHRGVRLAVVMTTGAMGLAAMFAFPVRGFLKSLRFVLVDPDSVSLIFVVAAVLVLATVLKVSGRMERGLRCLGEALGSRKLTLAAIPAVIGLLPMPGGAAFSAPPVGVASTGLGLSPHRKSLVNYVFRHVWQYSWPLCPGLLIAAALAEIPVSRIALSQLPLTVTALLSGWVFVMWGITAQSTSRTLRAFPRFMIELAPVGIGIAAGFAVARVGLAALPQKAGLGLGLTGAIAWVWIRDSTSQVSPRAVLRRSRLVGMLAMVASVLLFQQVLQDSGCLGHLATELSAAGIPLVLLAPILSLVTGFVGGIEIAFAGTALPLLLGIAAETGVSNPIPLLALIFAAGMVGVMLSPLHLCLILTREYFGASVGKLYGRLIGAMLPVLGVGIVLYVLLG